jgi:hypothetical protein
MFPCQKYLLASKVRRWQPRRHPPLVDMLFLDERIERDDRAAVARPSALSGLGITPPRLGCLSWHSHQDKGT